jgi:hypothetical protein
VQGALRFMSLDAATPVRIHSDDPATRCIVLSLSPASRACGIAKREHRSNHTYYQMLWDHDRDEWHLRQRCHSAACADKYCSVGFVLPTGHARTTQASASVEKAIATTADRWMARLS